jgi:hypothetical protein
MIGSIKSLAMTVLQRHSGVPVQSQPLEPRETSGKPRETVTVNPSKLAPCGQAHCAGCYEVDSGRRIHPPKPSADWLEWLERWVPPKKLRGQ